MCKNIYTNKKNRRILMKSWLHKISESYVSSKVTPRKDLKENYVSLTEEQRFSLLSENVLVYLDEQLQNAYGFGIYDLNEEELGIILEKVYRSATDVALASRERPVKDGDFFQHFVRTNAGGEGDESLRQPTTSLTGAGTTSDPGLQRQRRLARREQLGAQRQYSENPEEAERGKTAVQGVRNTRTAEEGKAVQDAATQVGSIGTQITNILGPKRRGPLGMFGANPARGGRADSIANTAGTIARMRRLKGAGRRLSGQQALSGVGLAWRQQGQ